MRVLLNLGVFVLITLTFFVRGEVFESFSISKLLPISLLFVIVCLFVFILLKRKKLLKFQFLFGSFIFISLLILLVNSIFFLSHINTTIKFLLELLMNFFVFYSIYLIVYYRFISLNSMLWMILISSIFAIVPVFFIASELETIRRIGTTDAYLPIAINHLGHSLAIVSIIAFYFLQKYITEHKYIKFLISTILFASALLATFLTGSKAAFGGVIFYFLIVGIIYFNKNFFKLISLSVLSIFTIFLVYIQNPAKYNSLVHRFSLERIELGFAQRTNVAKKAIEDLKSENGFLLGEPYHYQLLTEDPENAILYPHNIILSVMLHLGIIPMILFLLFIINRTYIYLKQLYTSRAYKNIWIMFNGIWITLLMYSLTSGRLTRIITIFLIIGMIEGWRKYEKNNLFVNS